MVSNLPNNFSCQFDSISIFVLNSLLVVDKIQLKRKIKCVGIDETFNFKEVTCIRR